MSQPNVDTFASVLDLERRVALLEQGLYGHSAAQMPIEVMTRAYLEAHRALSTLSEESLGVWTAQAYLWDTRAFVVLGRHVNDPYPFRPFLAVLDACVLRGAQGSEAARGHLLGVSQDLLNAQGLEVLEPRDVMGGLRLRQALARLQSARGRQRRSGPRP